MCYRKFTSIDDFEIGREYWWRSGEKDMRKPLLMCITEYYTEYQIQYGEWAGPIPKPEEWQELLHTLQDALDHLEEMSTGLDACDVALTEFETQKMDEWPIKGESWQRFKGKVKNALTTIKTLKVKFTLEEIEKETADEVSSN